jgi:hypothetical protein
VLGPAHVAQRDHGPPALTAGGDGQGRRLA